MGVRHDTHGEKGQAMPDELKLRALSELEAPQRADCFVLLVVRELAKTREQRPYYRVQFRDRQRTATVMVWGDSPWYTPCHESWQVGQFYKVRARYFENQYGPQLELERIRPVEANDASDGFAADSFFASSRFDRDGMLTELRGLAATQIRDAALSQLVVTILDRHGDVVRELAAAHYHHHTYRGGFLEHVLSVTNTALYLADKYCAQYPHLNPPLSRDLVIAGAILHDIGKVYELRQEAEGAQYTAAGRLIGHIVLGRDVVRDAARDLPDLDPELQLRLEHIIVSHQATPEWGSPVAPSTPEALLVYAADDVDARLHMMTMALATPVLPHDAEFTGKDNPLERRIFRGLMHRHS